MRRGFSALRRAFALLAALSLLFAVPGGLRAGSVLRLPLAGGGKPVPPAQIHAAFQDLLGAWLPAPAPPALEGPGLSPAPPVFAPSHPVLVREAESRLAALAQESLGSDPARAIAAQLLATALLEPRQAQSVSKLLAPAEREGMERAGAELKELARKDARVLHALELARQSLALAPAELGALAGQLGSLFDDSRNKGGELDSPAVAARASLQRPELPLAASGSEAASLREEPPPAGPAPAAAGLSPRAKLVRGAAALALAGAAYWALSGLTGGVIAGTPLGLWGGFALGVLALLSLDLGVFHKKSHAIGTKEALIWTAVWVALALAFGAGIGWWRGGADAVDYLTGYVIEKSLSVDNLFVFYTVFSYFKVPEPYQHKVLAWGILGAFVMRLGLIAAGAALIHAFHGAIYVFALFLLVSGAKMLLQKEKDEDFSKSRIVRFLKWIFPFSDRYHGDRFFTLVDGRKVATLLLLVLGVMEFTDLVFALDSIPAIFGVTTDPFLVFTSNVFAILGLRALYFALAGAMRKIHYLKYALASILIFVGLKMILASWIAIPTALSLGVIAGLLTAAVLASRRWPPKNADQGRLPEPRQDTPT